MKAVIFDFDGTIADSLLGVLAVYERSSRRSVPKTTQEVDGFRRKSLLRIALDLHIPLYKIVWLALFGRRDFRKHVDKVSVYKGMGKVLKDLHAAEVPVHIVSVNTAESIYDFLRVHGLEQYVRSVYGKAFFLNKAPRLRSLIRQEGYKRDEIYYVGDEVLDIKSARRAGVRCAAVSWGYNSRNALERHEPAWLIDTSAQLAEVLR